MCGRGLLWVWHKILHYLKDEIMVSSLFWVMQDLYHQPYECSIGVERIATDIPGAPEHNFNIPPKPDSNCYGLGFRVQGLGFRD